MTIDVWQFYTVLKRFITIFVYCALVKKIINIDKQKNIFKTSLKSSLPSFSSRASPVHDSKEIGFSEYSKPESKPSYNV